jgi:hypothetical protein
MQYTLYVCRNIANLFSVGQPCLIKQPDPHSAILRGLSEQTVLKLHSHCTSIYVQLKQNFPPRKVKHVK